MSKSYYRGKLSSSEEHRLGFPYTEEEILKGFQTVAVNLAEGAALEAYSRKGTEAGSATEEIVIVIGNSYLLINVNGLIEIGER